LLPGWTAALSWDALKLAVMARYPACQDTFRYTFADLLSLVERRRLEGDFGTVTEWSSYFNEYLVISQHLLARNCLCSLSQSRHLLASLSPSFHHEILSCMQRCDPSRDPESLPSIEDIDTAACYCLRASYHIASRATLIDPTPLPIDLTVSESATLTAPIVPCILSSIPTSAALTHSQLRATPDHQPVTPPGISSLQSKLTCSDSACACSDSACACSDSACACSDSACARSQSHSNSHGLDKDHPAHLPQPYIASAVQTWPSLAVFKTRTTIGERSEKELTVKPLAAEHHYCQPLAHYAPPCDRVFTSKPPKPRHTRTCLIQVVPPSISPNTSPQLKATKVNLPLD